MTQDNNHHPKTDAEILAAIKNLEHAIGYANLIQDVNQTAMREYSELKHDYFAFCVSYFYTDKNLDSKHRMMCSATPSDRCCIAIAVLKNAMETAEATGMTEQATNLKIACERIEDCIPYFNGLTKYMAERLFSSEPIN